MTPAELALVILAVVQTALLVWLLVLVRRKPADSSRTPDFEALGRGLEGPFKRLAAEWEAERRRLAEQTAQAGELVARLTRLQFQSSVGAPESDVVTDGVDTPSSAARHEARRRLAAGEDVAEVAEATGLPDGEVRVLAAVLKRGG